MTDTVITILFSLLAGSLLVSITLVSLAILKLHRQHKEFAKLFSITENPAGLSD